MKTIEISNEMLYNNVVCKTNLQNHVMKEKEYISLKIIFTYFLYDKEWKDICTIHRNGVIL